MIAPKKSLGQHFLHDENIVRKIVESLQIEPEDVIVEIGPGKGALTKHLTEQSGNVMGIEVDRHAVDLLNEIFEGRLTIIHDDVLKVDLVQLGQRAHHKLRIVGNIPYYITTEILFWLFDQRDAVTDSTLMMQYEVAKRLSAKPRSKDYGILSVFTQFYAKPELLFHVSRNSFSPRPSVNSSVVRLDFTEPLPSTNMGVFKSVVRCTFGKRRKTLKNGLKSLGLTKEQLEQVPFDLGKRPEDLSLEDFLKLTKMIEATMKP